MKKHYILGLLILCQISAFAQEMIKSHKTPVLPPDLKISYPNSNPFKEALKPLPESAIFEMEDYFVWDPSVIKVGDTYHLFCSRWPAKDGMKGWMKSHVIRATSNSLFGPYKFQEVVLHPSNHPWAINGVHNPKIIKTDNKYLIYHLGIPRWQTGFAFADSIEGPWIPVAEPVIKTNNPALLVHEDGRAYAVGKFKPSPHKDGRWDACMNAFQAPSYDGPYELVKDNLNRLPNNFELEDPTIWFSNNQYNVICTDWEAKATGIEKSILYYTSKDGVNYELYSQIPISSLAEPIPLENGGELNIENGLERPQVYLNEKGEVSALLSAIRPTENKPISYIIIRPVDNFVPNNK